MATQYPNNLEITVEQPVDTRLSAKDIAERNSFKYRYPGLLTYVRSEGKFYYYDGGWKELSAGIKIVTAVSQLDSTAPDGSLAVVVSANTSTLYIKENGVWKKYNIEVVNNLNTNSSGVALSAAMGKVLNDSINQLKEYREMSIDFGKNEDTATIAIMQPSIISNLMLINVSKLLLSYDGQVQQEYTSGQVDLGTSDYLVLEIVRNNEIATAVIGLTLKNK